MLIQYTYYMALPSTADDANTDMNLSQDVASVVRHNLIDLSAN